MPVYGEESLEDGEEAGRRKLLDGDWTVSLDLGFVEREELGKKFEREREEYLPLLDRKSVV